MRVFKFVIYLNNFFYHILQAKTGISRLISAMRINDVIIDDIKMISGNVCIGN